MIYTKLGDNGLTSTLTHKNISKNNKIFEVLGTLDEVNASFGLAKIYINDEIIKKYVNTLQKDIILISSSISGDKIIIDYKEKLLSLEKNIDLYEKLLPKNDKFIIFGEEKISTLLNTTRTIIRRLERKIVNLKQLNFMFKLDNLLFAWVNRLSDFVFILARYFLTLNNDNKKKIIINNTDIKEKIFKIQKINDYILTFARKLNVNSVIAICDSSGNTISVLKDDNAYIASIDIAINKAYTSVILKMSTEKLAKLSNPLSSFYGIQYTNNNRIVIFGGGIPIYDKNNEIIFGLGISGGSVEEDIKIAEYGYKKFMEEFFI